MLTTCCKPQTMQVACGTVHHRDTRHVHIQPSNSPAAVDACAMHARIGILKTPDSASGRRDHPRSCSGHAHRRRIESRSGRVASASPSCTSEAAAEARIAGGSAASAPHTWRRKESRFATVDEHTGRQQCSSRLGTAESQKSAMKTSSFDCRC